MRKNEFGGHRRKIIVTSNFEVSPQDFKIEIPSLVKNKRTKVIEITLNFELVPQ